MPIYFIILKHHLFSLPSKSKGVVALVMSLMVEAFTFSVSSTNLVKLVLKYTMPPGVVAASTSLSSSAWSR